jgi:hypothetical protein
MATTWRFSAAVAGWPRRRAWTPAHVVVSLSQGRARTRASYLRWLRLGKMRNNVAAEELDHCGELSSRLPAHVQVNEIDVGLKGLAYRA